MNYGSYVGWDDVVVVEEPTYYDWDCPDGYTRDDWGQCVPEVREVFVIEREILYLYPDVVAMYPDLQLHPEFLFRYRPELRTRYANIRSVSELRNRYTSYHHTAPPQRPASAPPVHGGGKGTAKTPGGSGAPSSKHAHGQSPAQQPSTKSPGSPVHGGPAASPMTPSPMTPSPMTPGGHAASTTPPAQHAALASPSGSPVTVAPKSKTATSGLFTNESSAHTHLLIGGVVGAVLGVALTGGDKEYANERLKFILFTAGCGAIVGAGVGALRQKHAAPRVGYYVPGLFPETREWLENDF